MLDTSRIAAALDKYVLDSQDREYRTHLGASTLGDDCPRKVFYKWRWAGKEEFPARMLRLFNRGHREEPRIISLLRGAGFTVWDAGESGAMKAQMRISAFGGHFGGTPDGVILGLPGYEDTPFLLEMKTHAYDLFQTTVKDQVFSANFKYYIQMQIYMLKLELEFALYIGVNKDNDEIYYEIVPFKKALAEKYLSIAGELVFARTPPPKISESPGWHGCKYCFAKSICHFDVMPDVNCRTCAYATPERDGTWSCARGLDAITTMPNRGCAEHVVNPEFREDLEVVNYDFEANWIEVSWNGCLLTLGPKHLSSEEAKKGLVPF